MKTKNISKFVLKFIRENKNSNQLIDEWNSEKNLNALESFFKKKDKDITKPKRGKSSYLHFCDDYRSYAKKQIPNSTNKEILNYLGDLWKETKAKKPDIAEKYEKIAKEERDRYKKQMAFYKSKNNKQKKEVEEDIDNPLLEDKDIELLLSIKEQIEQNEIKEEQIEEQIEENEVKEEKKEKRGKKDEVVEVKNKDNQDDKKGFERYLKKRKNKFMEEYPELDSDQLFAKMKKKWASLSEEKKQKYIK